MGARLVVIERIRSQHSVQVPFPKDQDLIQAFAPDGPDQTLWCRRKRFSISSCRRDFNKLATNVLSKWRMASITPDHATILRDRANPLGWNFRERQGGRPGL